MHRQNETLQLHITRHIAHIVLQRASGDNVLDDTLSEELHAALSQCENKNARCLLVSARGAVFCREVHDSEERDPRIAQLATRMSSLAIPSVCAVQADASGAGADLALACDVVYALQTARFIKPFRGLGLGMDTGTGTDDSAVADDAKCTNRWLAPKMFLYHRMLALGDCGAVLTASEAEAMGLIGKCVKDEHALTKQSAQHAAHLAAHPAHHPTRVLRLNTFATHNA